MSQTKKCESCGQVKSLQSFLREPTGKYRRKCNGCRIEASPDGGSYHRRLSNMMAGNIADWTTRLDIAGRRARVQP